MIRTIARGLTNAFIAGLLVGVLMTAYLIGQHWQKERLAAPVAHTTKTAPAWTHMLPATMRRPCKYEDSVNCYWDAGSAGNHKGHSFVVRQFPGGKHMVCVMYVRWADARKWDYCS